MTYGVFTVQFTRYIHHGTTAAMNSPPPPPIGGSLDCQLRKRDKDNEMLAQCMVLWRGVNEAWEMYTESEHMLKKALTDNNLPRALLLSDDMNTAIESYCVEVQRLLGHPSVIPDAVYSHTVFLDEIRRRLAEEGELRQMYIGLRKLESYHDAYFLPMNDAQSVEVVSMM